MSKILIIEDESTLQQSLKEFLTDEGFKIISALDGDSGVKLALKEKPDLIMLDIILPKKNGFEVLAELKKKKKVEGTPIIILTSMESPESIEKAFALGVRTYLIKSNYTLKEIAEKIKGVLKGI